MLTELPHFNYARRYVVPLLTIGAVFAVLGLACLHPFVRH